MPKRNFRHLILSGVSNPHQFQGRGGPSKRPSPVSDRHEHARLLLQQLHEIKREARALGTYINIRGRVGEPFVENKFDVDGLQLLKVQIESTASGDLKRAVTLDRKNGKGIDNLIEKITQFDKEETTPKTPHQQSHPKNADLANSAEEFSLAGIQDIWQGPGQFPDHDDTSVLTWEVWIDSKLENSFRLHVRDVGIELCGDPIKFPDEMVFLIQCSVSALEQMALDTAAVHAVGPHCTFSERVSCEAAPEEQATVVQDLLNRITIQDNNGHAQRSYVTLLDTGVSLAHPLIQPVIGNSERFVAKPGWDPDDRQSHGTEMAGLAAYGDLRELLRSKNSVTVTHRLESSKIIPDAGKNEYDMLGTITQSAIVAAEMSGQNVRTFVLASTTKDDTPHSGAPTSWSSVMDQLAAGSLNGGGKSRLIAISAGNIRDTMQIDSNDYLALCDHADSEIEAPAQAWNPITVGAMTGFGRRLRVPSLPLAEQGDLMPTSRTASWDSTWPIKPDVVLEGGNMFTDSRGNVSFHDDLALLTTSHDYPASSFGFMRETSAATALVGRELALLRQAYPKLWPETIRALYVNSARWTKQMRSHVGTSGKKADLSILFQRYGYGVPDLSHAMRSATNAVTLIVEDYIQPFRKEKNRTIMNQMKFVILPWPNDVLRELGSDDVTLRIALSYHVIPNPKEARQGRRDRYGSFRLRFELKAPGEHINNFQKRISGTADKDSDNDSTDYENVSSSARWKYGTTRRNVGSLHIDTLTDKASNIIPQNCLAVYPVGGWMKDRKEDKYACMTVRYSLVVEIESERTDIDLYTAIAQQSKVKEDVETQIF